AKRARKPFGAVQEDAPRHDQSVLEDHRRACRISLAGLPDELNDGGAVDRAPCRPGVLVDDRDAHAATSANPIVITASPPASAAWNVYALRSSRRPAAQTLVVSS